jgi:hypothetical protein
MGAKRFRIAFSFAGEKRGFVEKVAGLLAQSFGKEAILYDKFHEAEFCRARLGRYLPKLYHEQSDLVVVVICRDYSAKEWCGLEWDAIFDLLKQRRESEVMLSRFDNAIVDGLFDAGFSDLDYKTPEQFAELILERLAFNEGKSKDYYTKPSLADDKVSRTSISDKQDRPVSQKPESPTGVLPVGPPQSAPVSSTSDRSPFLTRQEEVLTQPQEAIAEERRAAVRQPPPGIFKNVFLCIIGIGLLFIPLCFVVFNPSSFQRAEFYLRVITALGGALVGAAIPGFLEISFPGVRAGGAMVIFALIFLVNPPKLTYEGLRRPSLVASLNRAWRALYGEKANNFLIDASDDNAIKTRAVAIETIMFGKDAANNLQGMPLRDQITKKILPDLFGTE